MTVCLDLSCCFLLLPLSLTDRLYIQIFAKVEKYLFIPLFRIQMSNFIYTDTGTLKRLCVH